MNAETLMRWKEAGVLMQTRNVTGKVAGIFTVDEVANNCKINGIPVRLEAFPVYRAPGHVQPHDGSSERPEWVAEDALVVARLTSSAGSAWVQISANLHLWQAVDYFIVLPNIGGNNEQ